MAGHSEDVEADGPDGVRRMVRVMWKQHADLIKISVNGAQSVQEYTRQELDAIVDEAHRLKLRVACHASMLQPARDAVAAGMDTIEHGCHLDRALAQEMADKGIFLVPTAAVYQILVDESATRPFDPVFLAALKDRLKTHREAVELALAAGVRMGAGTDMDLSGHPKALASELEYLVRYGLSPLQAIQAATRGGAEALGVEERLGTIEAGKLADCIVIGRDPLADITALRSPEMVIQGGKVVYRKPPD
jgi:imidazolonepropionase-like amidohydrolase